MHLFRAQRQPPPKHAQVSYQTKAKMSPKKLEFTEKLATAHLFAVQKLLLISGLLKLLFFSSNYFQEFAFLTSS